MPTDKTPQPLTCLDLFCGCGGFTLGMERAGFRVLAAIDSNPQAIATLHQNLPRLPLVLERDLTQFPPAELARLLPGNRQATLDVIVGGPPCQGFSTARQRDGANHGERLKADPRRHLYLELLRYVDFFQPSLFVMENVLGLRTAVGGAYFTAVQNEARSLGYRVHGQIEDACALGIPQKRRRQLIIGVRGDLPGYFLPELRPAPRASGPPDSGPKRPLSSHPASHETSNPTLWDAIGDLPPLHAGEGEDKCEYDFGRRLDHFKHQGATAKRYLCDVLEIDRAFQLTNHVARPHSDRDLRDFALLREGENSAVAMRERGISFEFPYKKTSFTDRYTKQSRREPCSTIVAHLSKDGLMFIHPTQNRSLTPREAARIQSFPDWFRFPTPRTHAFRLIGNAVPPLIGEAVGLAVRDFLASAAAASGGRRPEAHASISNSAPRAVHWNLTRHTAARELQRLAELDRRALRALPKDEFLCGWHALLFLFPGLHPDNARDHGTATEELTTEPVGLPSFERELDRRYTRSGWPVRLEPIGREAYRRYEHDAIAEDEFYCAEAQRAGLMAGDEPAKTSTKE